ncbi:MAG: 2-amino-4-hydroxy-6-hydroxymethyldihydropteridine diphosphokinase [Coleofasciculaceae cyanobacterium SM2_3_26]|nr:2-amino-4-hydroxy-6-hydroxymethyldihydropteridine diphosphokinase [Coleofasciculaceae cyanobacterium SM2_3_26]
MDSALAILAQQQGITLEAASSWYWTAAVGPPQPDYLNRCATLHIEISPEAMLDTLLAVEQQFGRVRRERWGPRTLDLDLLLVGDRILDTPKLQLPHPRMRERAFVLVPLAEIAPDWVDPISQEEIGRLAQQVDRSGVRRLN